MATVDSALLDETVGSLSPSSGAKARWLKDLPDGTFDALTALLLAIAPSVGI